MEYILQDKDYSFLFNNMVSKYNLNYFINKLNFLLKQGSVKYMNQKDLEPYIKNNFIGFSENIKIDFFNSKGLLNFLSFQDKSEIIKMDLYFAEKNINFLSNLTDILSDNNISDYWNVFLTYTSLLNNKNNKYRPDSKRLFGLIEKHISYNKNYVVTPILRMIDFGIKNKDLYSQEKLCKIFLKFIEIQKTIPKQSYHAYEKIKNYFEKNHSDIFNEILNKSVGLKEKLNSRDNDNYIEEEGIYKSWSFNLNELSVKNGNFNIITMKNNLTILFGFLGREMKSDQNVKGFYFNCKDSNIGVNFLPRKNTVGENKIKIVSELIKLIFEQGCKNKSLRISDIESYYKTVSSYVELDVTTQKFSTENKKIKKI